MVERQLPNLRGEARQIAAASLPTSAIEFTKYEPLQVALDFKSTLASMQLQNSSQNRWEL